MTTHHYQKHASDSELVAAVAEHQHTDRADHRGGVPASVVAEAVGYGEGSYTATRLVDLAEAGDLNREWDIALGVGARHTYTTPDDPHRGGVDMPDPDS